MARRKRKRAHSGKKSRARKTHYKKRHTPKWSAAHRRAYKAAKRKLIAQFNRGA